MTSFVKISFHKWCHAQLETIWPHIPHLLHWNGCFTNTFIHVRKVSTPLIHECPLSEDSIGTKSMQNNISIWKAKIIWQPWSQSDPSGNLYLILHSKKLYFLICFNNSVVTFKICHNSVKTYMFSIILFHSSYFTTIKIKLMFCPGPIIICALYQCLSIY